MNAKGDIVIVGVGGQGIVLASTLISDAALRAGCDVKSNEVHGMAQRGGSVMAHVRFAREVHSPLVEKGRADLLIAMEIAEGLRHAEYLSRDGLAIVSTQRIIPVTVSSGGATYPRDPEGAARSLFNRLFFADCMRIAGELGNPRVVNSILVGCASNHLPFPAAAWDATFRAVLPARILDVNLKAFEKGRGLRQEHRL
ncbi:indolepyruvate oxidoreductase subunit beta [bacterium]|nr:indolepyruvate oxidoreductase subunit beta [bacterium]